MKKLFVTASLVVAYLSNPTLATEAPVLTLEGQALGRYSATHLESGLTVQVNLNGDHVSATYVTARFQNNTPRQRLASGYWQPWDERTETLQDNAFEATDDGLLTFEITDESMSGQFLPIVFTVSYRTDDGIKSGYVVVDQ